MPWRRSGGYGAIDSEPSRCASLAMRSRRRQIVSRSGLLASDAAERECVARIRLADERAFESLFHAYYAALCDFVQSYVRSPDVAEELVQAVFLRIWEHRATWEPAKGT